MSKAIDLIVTGHKVKKQFCEICDRFELITYQTQDNIKFCSRCYGEIPEHIPLSQDSQYITILINRKKKKL